MCYADVMKRQKQAVPEASGFTPPEKRPWKSWRKELAGLCCLLLALLVFCTLAGRVLIPKRHDSGAVWGMYRKEPKNTVDVLFFGSSLVYCNLIPSVIWEETGLQTYLMAGPDQQIPVTYFYLREACKTQSPKAVFIEATAMLTDKPGDSAKVNLAYMPFNENRLLPTFSQVKREDVPGLLFPLYAYHDRWDDLTSQDWQEGILGYETDPLAGYTFLDQAMVFQKLSYRSYDTVYEKNLEYAEKMTSFCKEKGIRAVFFLAPRAARIEKPVVRRLERELTALGADFWDSQEDFPKLGIDLSADFFDELHFNYRGAEKFSRYTAGKLTELGLSPSGDPESLLWRQRAEHFSSLRKEWDSKPVRKRPARGEGSAP